jgi:hypothetical protein
MSKIKIKKLAKPVTKIIDIRIRRYCDKTYGNTYCAARATINNDFDNEQVYRMTYNQPDQMQLEILQHLSKTFSRLPIALLKYGYVALKEGILINVRIEESNQRDCKRFGDYNNGIAL